MPRLLTLIAAMLLAGGALSAEAKSYSADRFDSRVDVMRGGTLRVTETVVFRFEDGSFTKVFRELRTRETDGVEFVSASMDGVPFPEGEGPGTVEIRRRSTVRITWHFEPTSDRTHTLELTYLMRGAVREGVDADVLTWTALPGEHKYRIASSTVDIALPASPVSNPEIDVRRIEGDTSLDVNDAGIHITATNVRSNGWIRVTARMPAGSVIEAPPTWQQTERAQNALAPAWMAAAAVVLAAGLLVLFAVRQRYEPPPKDDSTVAVGPALPDALPPAEAGALAANGSARLEHAMATLLSLAERGELTIKEEEKKAWGQRRYTLSRRPARRPVAPYEQVALDIAFTHRGETQSTVPLDKARSRLTMQFKRFRRALQAELSAGGLLDAERMQVRRRFGTIGLVMILVAACIGLPLGILALDAYGAWPLLIPLALAIAALVALIAHTAHTPLSNEGIRRARYWRAFQGHLKEVARDRAPAPADGMDRLLPYAVALGLADTWSKYLKKHKITVPSWFHSAAGAESAPAFVAFVAYGGAASGGGAGGGVSGAGGGASGAS